MYKYVYIVNLEGEIPVCIFIFMMPIFKALSNFVAFCLHMCIATAVARRTSALKCILFYDLIHNIASFETGQPDSKPEASFNTSSSTPTCIKTDQLQLAIYLLQLASIWAD